MDFDFILEIICTIILNEHLFRDFLHGDNQPSVDILCHEDFAEFTCAEMLTDFEVFFFKKIIKEKMFDSWRYSRRLWRREDMLNDTFLVRNLLSDDTFDDIFR